MHVAWTKIVSLKCFQNLLVLSSAFVDELIKRPENLKLKHFLEKMTLCDV